MTATLADRVIVVTGGTGRLGQAVTKLLLERQARVIVTYMQAAELAELQAQLEPAGLERLTAHQVDVTDESQVTVFVRDVMEKFQRVDGLANLVGGWASKPFTEMTTSVWRQMLDLNLTSAFIITKAVLPHMVKAAYGRILAIGAQAAIQAFRKQAHFNVSKVGVMWLMESVSNEFKQDGITANAILPSTIQTEAEHAVSGGTKVWARPEEIAQLAAYLLSPESGATSGAKIPVYGKASGL